MKKILYVWKAAYPWDVRIDNITGALKKRGYEIAILARRTDEGSAEETVNGIPVESVGNGGKKTLPLFFNPFWKKATEKAIEKFKPDIVIVREMHIALQVAKAAKKKGVPVIMDMAENYPAAMRHFKSYNDTAVKRFIVHTLKIPDYIERTAVRNMDGIFTVCRENSERLARQYDFDIEKTAVVHNTPEYKVEPEGSFQPGETLTFGHHGYMTAEKSLSVFLKAFCNYAKRKGSVRLILAGEGDCEDDYKRIVAESRAEKYVEFKGSYDYQELQLILKQIDIGVIPYENNDFNDYTIHNKIFDYMALGKPVIVSNSKPYSRLIAETGAGKTIDTSSVEKAEVEFERIMTETDFVRCAKKAIPAAQTKYNRKHDIDSLTRFLEQF